MLYFIVYYYLVERGISLLTTGYVQCCSIPTRIAELHPVDIEDLQGLEFHHCRWSQACFVHLTPDGQTYNS